MNLFQRFSDILSANLSDWADQYEEPEVMLRQAIREMESAIDQSTEQTAKAMANEKLLAKELDRNRAQRDQWSKRAEASVEAGDDDMARGAIGRKNEYHTLVEALSDQLDASRESSQASQRQLSAMKAKLAEATRNLATLSARKRAADFRKKVDQQAIALSSPLDESAFAKFDRLQAKVERAEAEAEAMAELRGAASPRNNPVTDDSSGISAELSALKRKLGK